MHAPSSSHKKNKNIPQKISSTVWWDCETDENIFPTFFPPPFFLLLYQNVLAIILGGGAGTRLYPLTKKRAKPAVPLGANYRLIDIPVSNCINSDINKMYV